MNSKLIINPNREKILLQRIVIFALLFAPFLSWGIEAIPGDINKDGVIDILDVQHGVNIAIGISEETPIADVNQNTAVDVLDIQILINTVLGTGGLVQPVEGQISSGSNQVQQGTSLLLVALSQDGRIITSEISPNNGTFQTLLPVGTNWICGVIQRSGENLYQVFPLLSSIASQTSLSIPLLNLSTGRPLLLSNISLQQSNIPLSDLRSLLGSIAEPLPDTDDNANQIPDIYEQLIDDIKREFLSTPYVQTLEINENTINTLLQNFGTCLQPQKDILLTPSLNGVEVNGFPEMVSPLIQCLRTMINDIVKQLGIPGSENITNLIMSQLTPELQQQIMSWLESLQVPEVLDVNRNYIPDFIEDRICSGSNCLFDRNGNAVPDFLEDNDNDGIPNFLDPDSQTEQDTDGDSIPNELDLDANGNGILDYAESQNEK